MPYYYHSIYYLKVPELVELFSQGMEYVERRMPFKIYVLKIFLNKFDDKIFADVFEVIHACLYM